MKKSRSLHAGKPPLDLIEEATQLLRRAPLSVLLAYYAGTLPAVLGFLYFFSDMTRSAFGPSRLIESAFVMACLYVWMKCWQSVFTSGLRVSLQAETPARWSVRRVLRIVHVQGSVQPSGLFARLVAAQILIPYVWVYGFYQNVAILADGELRPLSAILQDAARQARLWPRQAHYALGLLFCFALVLALNAAVALFAAPQILKMFFGIETTFSRSPMSLLNTTVLATVVAFTYLAFDPIRQAVFVLRCFHGGALRTGRDLRVELSRIRTVATRQLTHALLVVFLAVGGYAAHGAEPARTSRPASAEQVNESIERVLQRREFTWRLPREKTPENERGILATFVNEFFTAVERRIGMAWKWVARVVEKIMRYFFGDAPAILPSGFSWSGSAARPALYAALGFALCVALIAFWRKRRRRGAVTTASPIANPVPDLRSDDVVADQLPVDEWLRLASELVQAGELRLALRASYLASLAHLGQRNLITIARHKSNGEYDRELRRRARARVELVRAFDENLRVFERAWYGLHGVSADLLAVFNRNLEQIRAC
jgi:hypothetical protein